MKQLFSRYFKNTITLTISLFMLFAATKTNAQWVELGGLSGNTFKGNNVFQDYIWSVATDKAGNVYAGGNVFDTASFNSNEYVAKWNGTAWSELGGEPFNGAANSIVTDAAGNVYAGGDFTDANDNGYVAKWNGTAWSELGGAPFNRGISSIAIDAAENVYAAGGFTDADSNFSVGKWNGTAWSELGGAPFNSAINSIAIDAAGNVYAAGFFTDADSNWYVAKWNGTAWSKLGGASGSFKSYIPNAYGYIDKIATDAAGNVYACGAFTDVNSKFYVAKWNGTVWSELGINSSPFRYEIESMATDAGGNVYAGADTVDALNFYHLVSYVAKWNGTSWSELGGPTGYFNTISSLYSDGLIFSIATDAKENVYAGGGFTDADGHKYVGAYTKNSLPLTLLNFNVVKQNNTAQLNWQTANEINTSYFNIQRSTDGRSFSNIGKVTAKGSNKVNNDYAYVDDISQSNADRLYYRLQEVDNDGKFNYSGVKIISLNKNNILFSISPNPAKDYINIVASDNVTDAQVSVTDMNGRMLYTGKQNFTANQQIKIPASQFSKQVLIVTVNTSNGKQEFKVVKE